MPIRLKSQNRAYQAFQPSGGFQIEERRNKKCSKALEIHSPKFLLEEGLISKRSQKNLSNGLFGVVGQVSLRLLSFATHGFYRGITFGPPSSLFLSASVKKRHGILSNQQANPFWGSEFIAHCKRNSSIAKSHHEEVFLSIARNHNENELHGLCTISPLPAKAAEHQFHCLPP